MTLQRAAQLQDEGQCAKAITLYQRAFDDAKTSKEDKTLAKRGIAECYLSLIPPNFVAAEDAAMEYLSCAEDLRDDDEIQKAYVTIGTVHLERALFFGTNPLAKAKSAQDCRYFLRKSIDLIPDDCAPRKQAEMKLRSLLNCIILECNLGEDFASLEEHVIESKDVAERHHIKTDLCLAYLQVAQYLLEREDFGSAETYLRKSQNELKILEGAHNYSELDEKFTRSKARLYIANKDFAELRTLVKNVLRSQKGASRQKNFKSDMKLMWKWAKRLRDVQEKINEKPKQAKLWEDLGDLYDKPHIKLRKKAIWAYEKALNNMTDADKRGDLIFSIGALYEELRDWQKAKEFFEKELDESKSSDFKESALGALRCACCLKGSQSMLMKAIGNVLRTTSDDNLKRFLKNSLSEIKSCRSERVDETILERLLDNEKIRSQDVYGQESESSGEDSFSEGEEKTSDQCGDRKSRRATKPNLNNLGETRLHLAVKNQKGASEIEKIVQENNILLNYKDKCGYTALIDACADGDLEVVQILLKLGANASIINDKNGVSPLMSACFGGFTYLIQPLMAAGARASLQDNNGWSAADYLAWKIRKERNDTDPRVLAEAEKLLKMLREQEKATSCKIRGKRGILHDNCTETGQDFFEDEFLEDDLRRAVPKQRLSVKRDLSPVFTENKPATISVKPAKKRSLSLHRKPLKEMSATSTFEEKSSFPKKRTSSEQDAIKVHEDLTKASKKPRLSKDDSDHFVSNMTASISEKKATETPPPPPPQQMIPTNLQTDNLSVRVEINGTLLRVFVSKDATVEDLVQESAKRYYDSYFKKPVLKLFDDLNAELHSNDRIALILATSSNARFNAQVIAWAETPLDEAYANICAKLNIIALDEVKEKFRHASSCSKLDLNMVGLKNSKSMGPIFKVLEGHGSLSELSVQLCRLGSQVQLFSESLKAIQEMKSLTHLDLTNNCLTSKNIADLAQVPLPNLKSLNLSFNNLTDRSAKSIGKICENCNALTSLSLMDCSMTSEFFNASELEVICQLSELDVSYNRLGVQGLLRLATILKKSPAISILRLNGCVKRSSFDDNEKLKERFSELQQSTEATLTTVLFKQNDLHFGDLPVNLHLEVASSSSSRSQVSASGGVLNSLDDSPLAVDPFIPFRSNISGSQMKITRWLRLYVHCLEKP